MTPEQLEAEVISLLKLQGWEISGETLLGHKKVDALARKPDSFGVPQTIAIEVKSGQSGCSRSDISAIYADYLPLIQTRDIDSILLVTENDVSPSGKAYLREALHFRHLTYSDLMNRIIDFSRYVAGLRLQFDDSPLASCYVPQDYEGGEETLEERILSWAHNTDMQPLAILGGYGLGKSTLASRVVSRLATQHEGVPSARIPILIPLSYLSTDQNLEGLLGRLFTTNAPIQNYNFDLFMALNRRGRFVVVLDGFDEMKRTMSWETLLYNLHQLNQLVCETSKVVLLGRPTAFLTRAEHEEALHGKIVSNRKERRLPGWPDYIELTIKPFGREQVKEYLNKVINKAQGQQDEQVADRIHKLRSYLTRMQGPEGRRLVDLVSRPVQLKMLVEVLPEYQGKVDNLTVALLYDEFIDLVIRRELEKDARQRFSVEARRRFAAQLAYWLWQDNQKSEIDGSKIPDSLFDEFCHSPEDDVSAIRRDLLTGCFLERKQPNALYFPHRSFQEYLVAERIVEQIKSGSRGLSECPFLTNEIVSFCVELLGRRGVGAWRQQLDKSRSALNSHALELFNACCLYHGLKSPFVESKPTEAGDQADKERDRQELVERRMETGILSSREAKPVKRKRHRARSKFPHKQEGVTRKKDFRRIHKTGH